MLQPDHSDQPAVPAPAVPPAPAGASTVDAFVFVDDAARLIDFVVDVFGATDVPEARTLDTDGLILHSELRIGDSLLTIADRKADWPYTPAFLRVYVDDLPATLERAVARGGRVVTEPTDFWGDEFSRFADPFGNLWWVYRHHPAEDDGTAGWDPAADWSGAGDGEDDDAGDRGEASWESFSTPELERIHSTLMDAMADLRDPRDR